MSLQSGLSILNSDVPEQGLDRGDISQLFLAQGGHAPKRPDVVAQVELAVANSLKRNGTAFHQPDPYVSDLEDFRACYAYLGRQPLRMDIAMASPIFFFGRTLLGEIGSVGQT